MNRIEPSCYVFRALLYHRVMYQFPFCDKPNAQHPCFVVFLQPAENLFAEVDVNWTHRDEPCLPRADPVELVVTAVIAFGFRLDFTA